MSEQLIDNQDKSTIINSKEFEDHLDSYLEKLLLVKTNVKLRQLITEGFSEVCGWYTNIADKVQSKPLESESNFEMIKDSSFCDIFNKRDILLENHNPLCNAIFCRKIVGF